jgi:DNA-binding transcriptional MerR regulator
MPASRAAGKSAAAFRTISEVSDELDVPQHVLRFWEGKFSQVRPLKRGGGRRYYRPEDIDLLRRIRNLLYSEGYTIKGVQRLLREGRGKDDEAVVDGTPQADDSDGDAGSELKAVIAELSELRDMLKKAGKGS